MAPLVLVCLSSMGGLRGALAFVAVTMPGCASIQREAPIVPERAIALVVAATSPPVLPGISTPGEIESPVAAAPPPSWGALYTRYFGPGSTGNCGGARGCHADAMGDATSAYTWLAQRGYIAGTQSPLVSPTNSCLRWFGGNMPPHGSRNDEAIRDLAAWVAAGAPDN